MRLPQILLVEDDDSLSTGLRSALESASFECVAVDNPQDAVQVMGSRRVDAIVLDVGLPSMDGLTLLAHLRNRRVSVPALVTSGSMGQQRARRAKQLRARFIQKPFGPAALVRELNEMLGRTSPTRVAGEPAKKSARDRAPEESFRARFRAAIRRISADDLDVVPSVDPRLPSVIGLLVQSDFSAGDISGLIGGDAGIVAQVLGTANSSLYPASYPVTDLESAVARIGSRGVLEIVVRGLARRGLGSDLEPFGGIMRRCWRNSAATAAIAAHVAPSRQVEPGLAYCAGLLLDLGEVAAYFVAADVAVRHGSKPADAASWCDADVQRIHPRLGANILRAWEVPAPMPFVAEHHHLRSAQSDPLVGLTAQSSELVRRVMMEDGDVVETPLARGPEEAERLVMRVRESLTGLDSDGS